MTNRIRQLVAKSQDLAEVANADHPDPLGPEADLGQDPEADLDRDLDQESLVDTA